MSGHRRVKTRAGAAPAVAVASFSVEETNEYMRVTLLENREMTAFSLKRHKLLGDELVPLDLYIIDVPSDGNCQFEALKLGLATLVEHPPTGNQEVRNRIADYLLAHKGSLEGGQQLSFQYGDNVFREAVFSAYDNAYTYEFYCALMRNPEGVKANCEWGDALTLSAARNFWSVNVLIHSVSSETGYCATYVDGYNDE